jgi:phytoene synthase
MTTTLHTELLPTLPPVQRLALAYAPASARPIWLGLLALDARLSGVVRTAREPVLGQLRLAWWRERLGEGAPPRGEPLLALLESWGDTRAALVPLVDGWEAMLGEAPRDVAALVAGRGAAVAALARMMGEEARETDAARLARGWALGDLPRQLAEDERAAAYALALAHDWAPARLPRALRPLTVLHGLARRSHAGRAEASFGALLAGIRLGIFGA